MVTPAGSRTLPGVGTTLTDMCPPPCAPCAAPPCPPPPCAPPLLRPKAGAVAMGPAAIASVALFLAAGPGWMDGRQQRRGVDARARVDRVGSALVLVAPKDSGVQAMSGPGFPLAARRGDGRLAMGEPNSVPAGKYGKAAL